MLSIWQRIRCIMQGWSTSTSDSTLFKKFLMRVTLSYNRFTRRWIPLICLPSYFWEWSLHIAKSYSISFLLLESVELVWMNYEWLDLLGRGYVGNRTSPSRLSRHGGMLFRLRFEKHSLRWRIVGRKCKILMVKFFNSLSVSTEFAWSVRMQQIREYDNMSSSLLCLSIGHLGCRQSPVDRPPWLSTTFFGESGIVQTNSVCWIGLSTALSLWAVSNLNSEFVSDPNLNCLFFLFS